MDDFETELKLDFLKEAQDLLVVAEAAFLKLEDNRDDIDLINEIFRLAHNLKGTSMAVGLAQMGDLTHIAESLLLKLKEGSLAVSDIIVSTLLQFNDNINEMVEGLLNDLDTKFDTSEMEKAIQNCIDGKNIETKPEVQEKATTESASKVEEPIELQTPPEDIKQQHSVSNKKSTAAVASKPDESIRVNLSRINKLNNMIGELVILQTVLDQSRFSEIQNPLINKSITQMGKIMKEVQEISMSLRMIPLNTTFNKMTRIVRDTSKDLGKDVQLHLKGENTEVDKTVLEYLSDPLVHIIRNAVDHGLESTANRIKAGKDVKGHIEIKAFHEGSNLVIKISDDGNGIDPKVIRAKAIEKGLLSPTQELSDNEIIQFIFHAGFSTKEQVTGVSGRGVGMDVVKTNLEKLSGEVKLESVIGKGSIFKIILPLTLAIIDAIVTKTGTGKYIFPLVQIHEFVHVSSANTKHVNGVGECIILRSEILPMFDLSKTLNCKHSDPQVEKNQTFIAVVIRQGEFVFAVKINEVINQQQVVIKQIGDEIKNQKGIMGSSILADGKPAFIVDLLELYSGLLKKNKNIKPA